MNSDTGVIYRTPAEIQLAQEMGEPLAFVSPQVADLIEMAKRNEVELKVIDEAQTLELRKAFREATGLATVIEEGGQLMETCPHCHGAGRVMNTVIKNVSP